METSRPVLVKRMPPIMDLRHARDFMRQVQPLLDKDRPQVVFDLSQVERLDAAGIEVLMYCMAEAMKRDGDVKLAGLTDAAMIVLEMTRTDRLFEIFRTSTDAVRSFSSFLPNTFKYQRAHAGKPQPAAPAPPSAEEPMAA